MTDTTGENDRELLAHVLLPVANEADATATATALAPYSPEHVTAVHVVEKGEGVPDKTPVEQSEELAAEAYAAVQTVFPDADTHTAYGRDVTAAIVKAGEAVGASVIAYRPRTGSRLMQFLSGDLSQQLVASATLPVLALPRAADDA
jgi:nucleotide-binding universal stress UspA family protein